MRTRTTVSGGFGTSEPLRMRYRSCGGSWGPWTLQDTMYSGSQRTKSITDISTPGFHALRKSRGVTCLPLNPLTIETTNEVRTVLPFQFAERHVSCSSGWMTEYDWRIVYTAGNFGLLSEGYPPDSAFDSVVNGAVAEARSAAWDSLTFLAELSKTRQLVESRLTELGRIAGLAADKAKSRVPRGLRLRSPGRILTEFASTWLEYRYGWMPLVYDTRDAVKALTRESDKWAVGRASMNFVHTDSDTIVTAGDLKTTAIRKVSAVHKVRGWGMAGFDFQNRYGFDPIVTGYELMPFSFILDWFIDVGTWLQAVTPFAPGRDCGSTASIKSTISHELWVQREAVSSGSYIRAGTTPSVKVLSIDIERYQRLRWSPSLPSWNPRLNLKRYTDLLALAVGVKGSVARKLRI